MKPEEMRDDIPVDLRPALTRAVEMLMEAGEAHAAEDLESALRAKPRTVHLPAADLPAPLEEVPEDGKVWTLDGSDEDDAVRQTAACAQDAVNNGLAFATQADAEAWLAHLQSWRNPRPGDDWTPHTPGDPMPCDGEARVEYRMREYGGGFNTARVLRWSKADGNHSSASADITAWRYARGGEG